MKLTFELMTLLVNFVFKISALSFISQIHENASLWGDIDNNCSWESVKIVTIMFLRKNKHKYLSTLHLKEHKLELSNSGTMSILWNR